MVVKAATKKRLLELGFPQRVAHLLATDRNMADIKELSVDEIKDINYGCFLRWINLNNYDNINLTTGAYLCEIQINDSGVGLICKNIFNKHFYVNMNEIILFQKLTNQEQILLSVMNHLNK